MNENEFFRQTTLKICGNLKIEQAMCNCIYIIEKFVPVDRMFLQIYEPSLGAMRTLATATPEKGENLDLLTPLPQTARIKVRKNLSANLNGAVIIDSPQENPVAREMLRFHGIEGWSVMRMTLTTEAGQLGGVVLTANGSNLYLEEHTRLLSLLKEPFAIALSNTLAHREIIKLKDLLADDNRYLQGELHRRYGDEIVGAKYGLKEVTQNVGQVARLDSPVLLLGETGVGKDVIANAIHFSSTRNDGPFVSVNCGAIPDTLIDSELFGHEKGAFTGALSQKRGRFERAHQGTIFLDEIGELPLPAQVRLLKVLQDKEIERVGGTKTISLNIRVIAATNRNLNEMVAANEFREDLYFRLNVFPIWIPPLRERKSDIPALVQHFISLKAKELKLPAIPTLATGAMDTLLNYQWPGNVRELQNVVERELILNPSGPLTFEQLNFSVTGNTKEIDKLIPEIDNLDEITSQHIKKVLSKTDGKIHGPGGAAKLLGINANTLRNRMDKLGIKYRKPRLI
jgi:formate hydrogenlyase transcriptional activator